MKLADWDCITDFWLFKRTDKMKLRERKNYFRTFPLTIWATREAHDILYLNRTDSFWNTQLLRFLYKLAKPNFAIRATFVVRSLSHVRPLWPHGLQHARLLHYLPEFAQIHVHWVGDAIWPSHLLLPPSPFTFHLSQHQGLFQWVVSSYQVAKVLELQLQHQSFRWIFRVDFL